MANEMNTFDLYHKEKWAILEKFFKKLPGYKSIDNKDIYFYVWPGGAGGDFLLGLFCDALILDERYATALWARQRNRFRFYEGSYLYSMKNLAEHSSYGNENNKIIMESYRFMRHLELDYISNIDTDVVDKIYTKCFKSLINCSYRQQLHVLPVIPYFYYKNFEKTKTILIDDSYHGDYAKLLGSIKLGITADLRPASQNTKVIPESEAILSMFNNNSIAIGIIQELLLFFHQDWAVKGSHYFADHNHVLIAEEDVVRNGTFMSLFILRLEHFIETYMKIEEVLLLERGKYNYWDTTAAPSSGMMNFLPEDQLYKVDYKKLFFDHDDAIIEELMEHFNSTKTLNYYKLKIKEYHAQNIKLFYDAKKELVIILEKLKREDR